VAQPSLDGQFNPFGRVNEGLDVIEKISQTPADANGIAEKPVRILKVTIEPRKVQPFLTASPDEMRRTVTMKTTLGTLKIKMEPDWAPENVRNFLMLTATGWYNGTQFHRVVKDFVAQGGATGDQPRTHPADRWIHPVKGEFRTDVKHVRGIVSMAHGDDPNSATTSFFIMLGPGTNLDGQFSAFARVVEGMEVLDAFDKEEVKGETPKRRVEIIEATVD
jgi:peptidyl-prolyl cis-trans isomerase B (cyclophilin B)